MFVTGEEFAFICWAIAFMALGIYIGYLIYGREFTFLGYFSTRGDTLVKEENPIEPTINDEGKWDWPKAMFTDGGTLEKEYYARPDNKDAPKIKRIRV